LKQISLSDFKKMSVQQIKDSQSLDITADGEHLAFLVIGTQEGMREKIRGLSSVSDAGRGIY